MSDNRNQNRAPASTVSGDTEAWNVASVARGYVLKDGLPVVGANGALCTVPAPAGFASLGENIRPFIAQSLLQMVQNRIVQTAKGNVQAAVNAAINDGKVPSSQSNDAIERHYIEAVTARVNAARPLPEKATDEQKAAHAKIIEATAIRNRNEPGTNLDNLTANDKRLIAKAAKYAEFVAAGFALEREGVAKKPSAKTVTVAVDEAMDLNN